LSGNFTFFNERICEIFGLTPEKTMGMNYKEYTDDRTVKVVFQTFNTVYRTREPAKAFNWEIVRKDNTRRHVEASVSLISDSKLGQPIGFRGIVRDITKRKEVESELQESEERYRTLINSMNEGVWVTDLDNKTIYMNPALEKMMGYTSEQMMEKIVTDFLHPDSFAFFEGITEERYERGVPSSTYELKWLRRDGSSLITRVAGTALYDDRDKVIGSFGLITDITTEKQALEALQESEERYRLLIELSPDAITLTDLEFNITAVNQEAIIQNGAEKAEDLIGKNALELIVPEDRQRAIENAQKTLSSGRIQAEYRLRRKDGTLFPVDLRASLVTDDKGNPSGFIAVTRDITERKKTEDALRERAILLQRMGEGVLVEDTEGYITYANPKATMMLGYTEEEIIGKHWRNFVVPEEHEKASVETEKRLEGIGSTYELTALTKDGSHLSVIITVTPLLSKSGKFKGVLDVFTDISERVQLEIALRQVKLEEERYHALLSHFVNNDLQKIISHTELISLQHESGQGLDPLNIDKIIDIASRSSRTIDSVNKIFEILQTPFTKPTDNFNLNKLIQETISELSFTYQHPVEINREHLNVVISGDIYLNNIFYELLFFLFHSCAEMRDHKKPIIIDGKKTSTYYYIHIRDYCSKPISKEISLRLSKKITEEWEAQGHYIGLALASVVMQHYGGLFKINAIISGGNEFQLFFPSRLIQPSTGFIKA
jgi:PAS domain S-box-containing protein